MSDNNNKKAIQEASRWLRVAFFTATVIGPVASTVVARLRELADAQRESEAAQELARRREQTARELNRRREEMVRELGKLGREARRELAERSRLWTALGFGIGLIIAGAGAYLLVRQRLWSQSAGKDDMIQLSQNVFLNKLAAKKLRNAGDEAKE
jgi:hypothetical protein